MSTTKRNNSHSFIKQGTILAAASLIVRMIGLLYRIPMSNILGEGGNALYAVAFDAYDIILIVSSYSLPLAVSKMIAEKNSRHEYKNVGRVFRCSTLFACATGSLAALFLFFGANLIEKVFYHKYTGMAIPLRVLAPTVFIVAIMGVLRGLFQGKGTMIPTAFSQLVEQIVNAFVSVYCAYSFMVAHNLSKNIDAYGAAGGTTGTLAGALSGLLILLFVYSIYRPVLKKQERKNRKGKEDSYYSIFYLILMTCIPVIFSQTIFQLSGILDSVLFGKLLSGGKAASETVTQLFGVYSSKYRLLISVPIAIANAMGVSMIPSMVASFTKGEMKSLRSQTSLAVKFNMLIAFPCAFGMMGLGRPIVQLLFPATDIPLAGNMLLMGGIAVVFYALSSITSATLQSINRLRIPAINSLISLILHIIIVVGLLCFTNLGIYSLVIANVFFPLVVSILNMRAIVRYTGYQQEILATFCIPFICSVIMAVASILVYYGIHFVISSNTVCVIPAILIAVLVYSITLLLFGGVTERELVRFPMGTKLVKIAKRLRLL